MQRRYEEAGVGLFEDPWRAVESIAAAVRAAERLERAAAAGPAGAGRPAAAAEGPHRRARGEAHPRRAPAFRSSTSGSSTRCRPGRRPRPQIGERLVLKIVSPDIPHKTEMGGVMLDVPAARGRRRLRPHDRADQGTRAARQARRRA